MSRLSDWLKQQYGDGKRHDNPRQLSLACCDDDDDDTKNEGLIGQIETRGTAKPSTLIRVARALGIDPIRIFIEAEWVKESDLQETIKETERQFLDIFRQLTVEDRHMLRRVAEGFRQTSVATIEVRRVADESPGYPAGPG